LAQQFDSAVMKAQSEVENAQAKIEALTSRIETAREKLKTGGDISVDIENASLDDVHAHAELMDANIADLIMGLDDVTAGFSKDFDQMREKTAWESFVGIFAKGKSDSMREERIRGASIDDKLQDLIAKSDTIVALLQSQLNTLNDHKGRVEGNLSETLTERETVVGELESMRSEIMGPRHAQWQLQRTGPAGAGASGKVSDAGALYRKGQVLGRQPAEPGGDADGADQQAPDRHQAASGFV